MLPVFKSTTLSISMIVAWNLTASCVSYGRTIPLYRWMMKLRLREVKLLFQGHTGRKW
jgi:hypothetical protein